MGPEKADLRGLRETPDQQQRHQVVRLDRGPVPGGERGRTERQARGVEHHHHDHRRVAQPPGCDDGAGPGQDDDPHRGQAPAPGHLARIDRDQDAQKRHAGRPPSAPPDDLPEQDRGHDHGDERTGEADRGEGRHRHPGDREEACGQAGDGEADPDEVQGHIRKARETPPACARPSARSGSARRARAGKRSGWPGSPRPAI